MSLGNLSEAEQRMLNDILQAERDRRAGCCSSVGLSETEIFGSATTTTSTHRPALEAGRPFPESITSPRWRLGFAPRRLELIVRQSAS